MYVYIYKYSPISFSPCISTSNLDQRKKKTGSSPGFCSTDYLDIAEKLTVQQPQLDMDMEKTFLAYKVFYVLFKDNQSLSSDLIHMHIINIMKPKTKTYAI